MELDEQRLPQAPAGEERGPSVTSIPDISHGPEAAAPRMGLLPLPSVWFLQDDVPCAGRAVHTSVVEVPLA